MEHQPDGDAAAAETIGPLCCACDNVPVAAEGERCDRCEGWYGGAQAEEDGADDDETDDEDGGPEGVTIKPKLSVPIRAALDVLCEPGALYELRTLGVHGGEIVAGFFDNLDALAETATTLDGRAKGIYVTLNPVNPALMSRHAHPLNALTPTIRGTLTTDADVLRRRWLLLDFDAERTPNTSASDAEKALAVERADHCTRWLADALGFPAESIILADSGNGAHRLVRVELATDVEGKQLVEACLKALALRFSDERVKVDTAVGNAARITKLYGTLVCKGESTVERPHRRSGLLDASAGLTVCPRESLERLAATLPREERPADAGGAFDVEGFAAQHGLRVTQRLPWNGGAQLLRLAACPFEPEHGETYRPTLIAFPSGAVAFKCFGARCDGKDWHALRDKLDPGWQEHNAEERLAWAQGCAAWFVAEPTLDALCLPAFQDALDVLEARGSDDLALVMKAREACKGVGGGLSVKAFDETRKRHKEKRAQEAAAAREGRQRTPLKRVSEQLAGVPTVYGALLVPRGHRLQGNATFAGWGDDEAVIAHAPVLLVGKLHDAEAGVEYFRLAWFDNGRWRSTSTDRGVALDAHRLVALASEGFPVNSLTAPQLVAYLQAFEAANPALPVERVSSHLGWQGTDGRDGFLWGRTHVAAPGTTPITFRGLSGGDEQLADGFASAGTLDDWLAAVRQLGPYPRVAVGVYASLAPPLLAILGAPNFIVDLANATSTGKTTAARIAASAWGQPDEKLPDSLMQSWDGTRVWLERAASTMADLPLVLDDTKRAKKPQLVAETLYAVAHGRGRGRGNPVGVDRVRTWRTVAISTGEAPATSFTQDGGTRMRCLEVRGMPFECKDDETRQCVDALNLAVTRNYGHAGPAVMRWLVKNRVQWPLLRAVYERAKTLYAQRDGRLASYMAALHVAAHLAHQLFDLPWRYGDTLAAVWFDVAAEAQDAPGAERALQWVVSWAQSNRGKFEGDDEAHEPAGGWFGRWDAGSDLCIYPHHLDRVLGDGGFEPEAIKALWREAVWLVVDDDRGRYTRRVRTRAGLARLVCVRRDVVETVAGADLIPLDAVPTCSHEDGNTESIDTFDG